MRDLESTSGWLRSAHLLVPLLPFVLEWLVWAWIDPFVVPTPAELGTAVGLCAGITLLALGLTRSLARSITLALVSSGCLVGLFSAAFAAAALRIEWTGGLNVTRALVLLSPVAAGVVLLCVRRGWCLTASALHALTLVSVLAALAAVLLLHPPGPVPRADARRGAGALQPDVILIVADTARADHFSFSGYERETSPGLDRFARGAAVFQRAMSPAPWTPPAHASILTGLLPAQHGTDGDLLAFDPPSPSLPELLRQSGYATGAVVNNPLLQPEAGWSRGFDHFHAPWSYPSRSLARVLRRIGAMTKHAIWYGRTAQSLRSARRWWAQSGGRPRFLFLNLIDPHAPYGEHHAFRDHFLAAGGSEADDLADQSELYDAGLARAEGEPLTRLIARYDGDIRHLDACLADFFAWLEQRGELNATLVVLTSDHGERLGERGLLGHQLGLDQVLLHVPLLVRMPQRIDPGRHPDPVQTHGIFATILALVGAPPPNDELERTPSLFDQRLDVTVAQMREQSQYLEEVQQLNAEKDLASVSGSWMTASDGTWKLWRSSDNRVRLHHVVQDRAEAIDVSDGFPDVVARLGRHLEALPHFERGEAAPEPREDAREMLRVLGYGE